MKKKHAGTKKIDPRLIIGSNTIGGGWRRREDNDDRGLGPSITIVLVRHHNHNTSCTGNYQADGFGSRTLFGDETIPSNAVVGVIALQTFPPKRNHRIHITMTRSHHPDHDDHRRQKQQRKQQRKKHRKQQQQRNLSTSSSITKHAGVSIISQPSINNEETATSSHSLATERCATPSIISHAIDWLEKRKKEIPDALLLAWSSSSSSSSLSSVDSVLPLLPSLRERERRALVRHLEKCTTTPEIMSSSKGRGDEQHQQQQQHVLSAEWGSDGEYERRDYYDNADSTSVGIGRGDNDGGNGGGSETCTSSSWPSDVEFSNNYKWDARVPEEVKDKYCPKISSSLPPSSATSSTRKTSASTAFARTRGSAARTRASHPSKKVYFRKIVDQYHPARGEFGLFCALPNGAPPGAWLLDYVGHISLGEHQDKISNYVCDFGIHAELSVDAATYGNESRFLNDYRNTGKHANCEFKLRWDARGELRQGVYVKQTKDSRDPNFIGVGKDEELLVSYGRSYWRSRVGNLTDFVYRVPGMPMPKEKGSAQRDRGKS